LKTKKFKEADFGFSGYEDDILDVVAELDLEMQ